MGYTVNKFILSGEGMDDDGGGSLARVQRELFVNAEEFVIQDAGRILYNLNTNEMFWGHDSYQKSVEYTDIDKSLKEHIVLQWE